MPLRRGQPAEFYVGIFPRTDVFRHHVQLCDRHIQVFLAGILNGDVVLGHALQFQFADSQKPADTVQGMHHQITGDNVRQCPDFLTAAVLFPPPCAGVECSALCDESRFGFRIGEAAGQAAGAEIDHARTPHAVRFRQLAADPAFLQVLLQDRQRFFTAGTEHGAVALTAVLL